MVVILFPFQTPTDEQLALIVAEARRRKVEKNRSEKNSKYEPLYTNYRKSLVDKKKAIDLSKSLLKDLKAMGWGKKETTTPKTTTTAPVKGGTKKK